MKATWIFYAILGMGYVFCVYMTTLGAMQWWYIVYYTILGFLGIMGIWYPSMRWSFLVGILLGFVLLVMLYKYDVLNHFTRIRFLHRFME